MTLHLKKSWIISLITSFVLLGGVLLSPATSADAAKVATSTYSDLDQSYAEFKEYTNQLFVLETYEAKAFTALESIDTQVTSTNRKSMYLKLTNTVIPNYTKLVSRQNKSSLPTRRSRKFTLHLLRQVTLSSKGTCCTKRQYPRTK